MSETSIQTQCCIAGGGPAGLMLGYLLARAGVDVVVLEKHADFLRDFRGDTIHPSTIDLLGELGLKDEFLALPHDRIETLDVVISGNRIRPIDFRRLHGGTHFLALMPQWDFLNFMADEASQYPNFRLIMQAEVTGIRRNHGRVAGVTAKTPDGPIDVVAALTVAADGRASAVRAAAGMVPREFGVAVDVLWFHLPKLGRPQPATLAYLDSRSMVITIPREGYYQAGMLIPKGGFDAIRAEGLDAFRQRIVDAAAFLAPAVPQLASWDEVKLLSVRVNRLKRWSAPGLLCIGDAAHAMSPAFGVGVNYAIQDAVASANLLAVPLKAGSVTPKELAAVQARRLPPVRLMQPIQLQLHKRIGRSGSGIKLPHPLPLRWRVFLRIVLPAIQRVAARMVGRGFRPEHLRADLFPAARQLPFQGKTDIR
ncbi:FAD-dependent oxidoreductase [Parafrigoribacterium mesophilum]|uniref:FAD-dependent oxidoreductase n=1 Tax=Parafrigoribacterium mesophilum TaxID=433646 RepID=UPI0031FBFFBE